MLAAVLAMPLMAECAGRLSGAVTTDGSTSMEKVIGILGEAFEAQNNGVTFTYNPIGSGSGIQAVLEGRCDIGLSSRSLKEKESARGLAGTVLAYDGIAVVVNPDNPVSGLELDTIAKIYAGKISNWKDVGGHDAEIVLIGREAGSGTRDGFESITGTTGNCRYRQELTSTGDVIATVSRNPDAIGYASIASVMRTTQECLKTVPQSYREGAIGLGAGKWRVIRTVVLTGCADGIITGCILSAGRILGESAALLFTAGFAHALNGFFTGLASPGSSLTVALYVYAKEQGEFGVAFAIAAILMLMMLAVNLTAALVSRHFRKRKAL